MEITSKSAAIDNDFINHLTEANISDSELISFLNIIFKELDLAVIIHPLVYDKEVLINKPRVKLLFDNQIVNRVSFSDIFSEDSDKKDYYFHLVTEFFGYLNDKELPVSGEDILVYWKKDENLGETHSLAMCLITGCGLFLSDDGDSEELRKYILRYSLGNVRVYNRKQLVDEHLQKGETIIGRTQRRSLAHVR